MSCSTRRWVDPGFVVLVAIMIAPAPALAQSAITGLVTDPSGSASVLPGVLVEATSPALIEKVRTAVTDNQGRYAIADLRPGVYALSFTLTGFAKVVQEGIDLPSNFTATVNVTLRLGAIEETITVAGATPVVDVQSAQRTSVLKRELVDALPTARTYAAEGALVVGIKVSEQNVGGARTGIQQRLTVHGSLSRDTTVAVDGMKMNTLFAAGDSMPDHNDAMTQEVTVQVSSPAAEVSAGGPHLNLLPREGGNTFSGANYIGYSNGSFQSDNLTPELRDLGLRTADALQLVYDINPSLGGPILRNKLWFFGSYRDAVNENVVANSFYPDGRPGIYDQSVKNYTVRLTWQATERNKITAYDDYQVKWIGHEFVNPGDEVTTGTWRREPVLKYTGAVKWTSPVSSRLLLDAAYGASANNHNRLYQPGVQKVPGSAEWYAHASRQDIVLGTRRTAGAPQQSHNYVIRSMITSSATYVTGSHTFKTGVQWHFGSLRSLVEANADLTQRYRDGVPDSVIVHNTPVASDNRMNADLGVYVQDTWTLRRLTLTPGVRYEYFNSSIEAQSVSAGRFVPARQVTRTPDMPRWSDVAPRLGVVYDLTGDATTALKGSVNKYHRNFTTDFASRYNPLNLQNDTRNWFDCDLVPGTSTCSALVLPTNRDDIAQDNEVGPSNNRLFGQAPARRPAPDIRRPYDVEYSLGVDHQVMQGVAVRAAWFRRDTYNQERQDNLLVEPSDYASFQTPSPLTGELITVYNLNRNRQGLVDILDTTATDRSRNRVTYNGFEVSFAAHTRGGNTLMGGWSTDKTLRVSCDGDDPNTLRYCDQRELAIPVRHDFKLAGSYKMPLGTQLGIAFQSYAGQALTVNWAVPANVFPGGRTQAVTVALVPPGSRYLERWNQLDLSFRKVFRLGRIQLDGALDVYNALNTSVVTQENQSFGSTLGQPQQILQGRLLRVSSQIRF
jgi:hypothetical protein